MQRKGLSKKKKKRSRCKTCLGEKQIRRWRDWNGGILSPHYTHNKSKKLLVISYRHLHYMSFKKHLLCYRMVTKLIERQVQNRVPNTSISELWQYLDLDTVPHFNHYFSLFLDESVVKMNLEDIRKLHVGDGNSNLGLFYVSGSYQTCFLIKCLLAENQTMVRDEAPRRLSP